MKLYIAEKPSLGRAIADVLAKPHHKEDGYIRLANGDCVSWCIGHLLEQAEPESYHPNFKKWRLEHLPIIPQQWQLQPKSKTKKQLNVLKKLIKQADQLIHAGDPDREGQLLIDLVIDYLGVSGKKRDTIQRCLINDLNPSAVNRALTQLRDNKTFAPLSTSALARARADWLYGINMTRAYTLQGQKVGYQGILSVGRVQTPILGLVVRRDQDIDNFISQPFYEVMAILQTQSNQQFKAKWQPSEACQPYMDEEGRVLAKKLAENVVNRITNKPGEVKKVEKKNKTQSPPLPYNLSSLQIDAANQFSMSAQQVLDHCQNLYERHKLITYPRSDNRYLPKEHYQQCQRIINAIGNNSSELKTAAEQANSQLKSKAWNDSKVEAHHAIIPTEKKLSNTLKPSEKQIYQLIARQYLCQFYPKYEYSDTRIEVLIEGGLFIATAHQPLKLGWKELFSQPLKTNQVAGENSPPKLPTLQPGETLHCRQGELLDKQTQPPKHFTDATLLAAMTGIARFVKDTTIRKILKETDGLGTEATRAGILELLFKRGFLMRQGKQIQATPTGRGLIQSLPETATTPDMTAQWESVLNAISSRQASYAGFMEPLTQSLHALIEQSKILLPHALRGISTNTTKSAAKKRRRQTKKPKKSAK